MVMIFELARILHIRIFFRNLRKTSTCFLGKADSRARTIQLDYSLKDNPRELRCILAEEIGHMLYPARPGHIRYHSKDFHEYENCGMIKHTVAQDETKALDWATGVLMPDVEFCRILENGNYLIGEIAEMFEVEPWFVEHKLRYYKRKRERIGRMVKPMDLMRRV